MIAVIAVETAAVTPLLNKTSVLRKEESGNTALFLVELRGEEFLIVTAGCGKANLGAAIAFAMEKFAIDTLIAIGDCCCVRRDAHLFDIAISSFGVQYDVDFTPLGCTPPQIPGVKGTSYLSDTALCTLARKSAQKLKYPAFSAAFATADRSVTDKGSAEKLRRRYHIDCTDIVCGVIGEMASVYGVSYLYVSGISCFADNDAAEMCTANKKRAQYMACHVVYYMLGELLQPQPSPCGCNGEEPVSCSIDLGSATNLSPAQIMEIIASSSYTRLSVAENGQPYTVPMAFSYHREGDKMVFCLYSKNDGKKMHCLAENSKVALCFDKGVCDSVSSVVVLGTAKVVHGDYHVTCNAQLSVIQITANQVTGRKYLFCE